MSLQYFNTFLKTPIGYLHLASDSESLISVSFAQSPGESSSNLPNVLIQSKNQILEYFDGTIQSFSIPTSPHGTDFQNLVWHQVKNVPFGRTSTYLNIALLTGSRNNTRAVGLANAKNPLPIIIPCHRIIASNGKLTGYAGGIERKRWLLQHELKFSMSSNTLF